ncbi:uncharacterized protein PAE49_006934 isoform 1-T5 [Odontesthes bonariensis]|uniref:uncharacterized protein LOC142382798 n=1 Tax=Odontesthes bonariensis TaxID=219752 RepID=UPI003F58FE5C
MNPYGSTNLSSIPCSDAAAPGYLQTPLPYSASNYPAVFSSPSPQLIHTGHSSLTVLAHDSSPSQASSDQLFLPSNSALPLPAFSPTPVPQSSLTPGSSTVPPSTQNPYPPSSAHTPQVSVSFPSPDLRPSPLESPCSDETCLDLECSICFSQFNNVFRCPKMLHCKHTFCLECLARINVKSAEPSAIQCPLCRSFTPLPVLGLPKLVTDSDVLSSLPAAMQRVYSIRFVRNKGKLQVKRNAVGAPQWGRRSLMSVRSGRRSLDVGLPSPTTADGRQVSGVGGVLFRLTGRPACRAFLLMSVMMMMVLLTGIVIFLLTFKK